MFLCASRWSDAGPQVKRPKWFQLRGAIVFEIDIFAIAERMMESQRCGVGRWNCFNDICYAVLIWR